MFKGLFDEQNAKEFAEAERRRLAEERRATLLDRACQFDLTALDDSREDQYLYNEILDELTARAAACQEKLSLLVGHIAKGKGLQASPELANRMIEFWKTSPDRKSTSQMLHIVALTNDATLYQKSIESAVDYWEKRLLGGISSTDLLALMESEYWVLASEARRAGAGFALNESRARLRQRLKG